MSLRDYLLAMNGKLSDYMFYEEPGITLFCGDCREILPLLRCPNTTYCLEECDGRCEPMVLVTDPPYGMAFVTGQRNGAGGWNSRWAGASMKGDKDTSLRDFVLTLWGDGPALVFATWKCPLPANTREVLVWDKVISTGMGALDIPWRPSWEAICVLGHGFTGARGHGVLAHSLPTLAPERQDHPTPKPLTLLTALIAKCPTGTILDPFAGSGTTLLAAKNLGRRAIGIEIEAKYCEIAVKRLRQGVLL